MTVRIIGIDQVKRANKSWFKTRVSRRIRSLPSNAIQGQGGTYFVVGSVDGEGKRRWTVHRQGHDGGIVAREYMKHKSETSAEREAKALASGRQS